MLNRSGTIAFLALSLFIAGFASAQGGVKTGDKVPDYTFRWSENSTGMNSLADMRGRAVLVDLWGYH